MKIIAPFGLLALAACAAPAAEDTASQAGPPEQTTADLANECNAGVGLYAVGKPFTSELAAEVKTKTGAKSLRVIAPGTMVTMDYRGDRLNISHDEAKVITKVDCG